MRINGGRSGHISKVPRPALLPTQPPVQWVPRSRSEELEQHPPPNGSTALSRPRPPHCRGFAITLRHATLGRTPLDEWSARRRDLYLTTHNTQMRQTSMPPVGFKPIIPASERPQTHALDRVATGIGSYTTGTWNWPLIAFHSEVKNESSYTSTLHMPSHFFWFILRHCQYLRPYSIEW